LGGRDDNEAGDVYREGLAFFDRNDSDMINEHLEKDGNYVGDRVHLQVELAQQAGIKNEDVLRTVVEKAGFTSEEKKRFFEQMKVVSNDNAGLQISKAT
jgi:hypothetical protein